MRDERRRCSIPQPRVARHELPWVLDFKSEATLVRVESIRALALEDETLSATV